MKTKTEVCELCRLEACTGRIFRTKSRTATWASLIWCESDEKIRRRNGKFFIHVVRGHGDEWDDELEEIDRVPAAALRYGPEAGITQARLPDGLERVAG
jgi:hypothetical protein